MPFALLALALALGLAATMTLAWALARRPGASGLMDVVWSLGTGAMGAAGALAPAPQAAPSRQIAVAVLALAWGLRLGGHIWWRGHRSARGHDDPRYAALKQAWGANADWRLLLFAQIQAVAALVLVLVIAGAARNPARFGQWSDWGGLALLAAAVIGEAVADAQLAAFRADPANRGKVCEAGLWGLSRHPNYFFEWLGWAAWPLVAIGPAAAQPLAWLTLAGPLMMYALLVHGSGIPPLEAHMLKSRGEAFASTQRRIRAFWPIPKLSRPVP